MNTKRYSVQYRRKREGKTDYRRRAALLLSGRPRIVVRRTLRQVIVQFVEAGDKGDRILVSAGSASLRKLGWKHGLNLCTAYLTGLLAGMRARKAGLSSGIADLRSPKGRGRIYAALKGVVDTGIEVPHDPSVFPDDSRLNGGHIKGSAGQEMAELKSRIAKGG
ncbi:50S ribosomal protein L18 [Candidatus Woesearchaeota archaeon]|nr:50S ribosomal protein L18 [Candidatus Woesearchaeota archaeon]